MAHGKRRFRSRYLATGVGLYRGLRSAFRSRASTASRQPSISRAAISGRRALFRANPTRRSTGAPVAQRTRFKGTGSMTIRTRRRGVVDGMRDVQKDLSRTKAVIRMGRMRPSRFTQLLGRVEYEQQYQGTFQNREGLQAVQTLFNIADMGSFVNASSPNISFFELNPSAKWGNTADTVGTWPNAPVNAAGVITSADNQLYYGSVQVDLTFANFSVVPTTLTLYAFTPRVNLNKDPFGAFSDSLAYETQPASASVAYPQGVTGPTAGRAAVTDYRQSPERIKAFNKMYRVAKRFTITLNAGSNHKFQLFIPYNRLLQQTYIQKMQDQGEYYARNLSVLFMAISRPAIVDQVNNMVQPGPTYGVCKVGWVASVIHQFKYPASSPKLQIISPNVLSNAAPSGAGFKEQVIDVIDAVIDVAAAAAQA